LAMVMDDRPSHVAAHAGLEATTHSTATTIIMGRRIMAGILAGPGALPGGTRRCCAGSMLDAAGITNRKDAALQFGSGGIFMRLRMMAMTLGLLAGTAPFLLAHHSFVAEYDANQPVKVTGVVTRVEWQNPHIWFFVDVKDAQGKVTNWGFSGGPPGVLQRRGISRNALKTGDTVVVEGFRARDGSNNASGGKVTFPDGRSVFTASNEDRAPQ